MGGACQLPYWKDRYGYDMYKKYTLDIHIYIHIVISIYLY